MARITPVHSGYTILNGAGTGTNGSRIDVWAEYCVTAQNAAEIPCEQVLGSYVVRLERG